MQKLFALVARLAGLLQHVDKAHDKITTAYDLWVDFYGWVQKARQLVGAGPGPAAPVVEAAVLEDPGYVAPSPLPDEAFEHPAV